MEVGILKQDDVTIYRYAQIVFLIWFFLSISIRMLERR